MHSVHRKRFPASCLMRRCCSSAQRYGVVKVQSPQRSVSPSAERSFQSYSNQRGGIRGRRKKGQTERGGCSAVQCREGAVRTAQRLSWCKEVKQITGQDLCRMLISYPAMWPHKGALFTAQHFSRKIYLFGQWGGGQEGRRAVPVPAH